MSLSASWQASDIRGVSAARDRAFNAARRHSRRVRLLRVVLPLAGLGGLAAFFALTHLGLPLPLDLSTAQLSVTPNAVIMEQPNFSGFDRGGRAYSVTATRAVQSLANPDQVRLEDIRASINVSGEGLTTIAADSGHYDHSSRRLRLEGRIAVDSADGYGLRMRDAEIDLEGGTMQSANPVTVTYADSTVTSQRIRATEGGRRILFEGGVVTKIMPPKRDAAAPAGAAASDPTPEVVR